MNRFGLSDVQAQAILDLRLQRLTGLELEALRKEYEAILKTIRRLEGILKSEKKLIAVIREEMSEIRERYADNRRTELIEDDSAKMPVVENKPIAEDTAIMRLSDGQIRRMSPRMVDKFIQQPGVAAEVVQTIQTATDESLYIFTNMGNCFMIDVGKIPETMRLKERGSLLTGLVAGLTDGEYAVQMLCAKSDEMGKFGDLLFVTRDGQVKRTQAGEYGIRRARFAAINLKGDDQVIAVTTVEPEDKGEILLCTRLGFGLRFKLSEISTTGRATAGVRGVELSDEDEVCWLHRHKDGDILLLISDRGFGKRMMMSDIDRQKRATKGQKLLAITKSGETGTQMAAVINATQAAQVSFTQKHGHVTTMNTFEIGVERRTGKGQLLISVLLDDVVTDASIVQ